MRSNSNFNMYKQKSSLTLFAFLLSESILCKNIPLHHVKLHELDEVSNHFHIQGKEKENFEKCAMFEQMLNHINPNFSNEFKETKNSFSEELTYRICKSKSVDLTEEESYLDYKKDQLNFPSNTVRSMEETNPSKMPAKAYLKNESKLKRTKRSKRASSIFNLPAAQEKCEGSLIISHDSRNDVLFDDFSKLRLNGDRFPVLKKLTNRHIYLAEVDGSCSWKLFSQPGFRGYSQIITDSTFNLDFHPKSALKFNET